MDFDALTAEALDRCDTLGRISDHSERLSRPFLSPVTRHAHALVTDWMRDAGLAVQCDAIGNLIGRRTGTGDRVFVVGSHIDTVPDAGKFDGVLGVMLGIAAAKALADRPFRHSLDVIAFSEEEGVRFRKPYLGSGAVCGAFDPEWLELTDAAGTTLAEAIREFGLDPNELPKARYSIRQLVGYLEPHIEQGPVLESLDLPLGVVETIVGQSRFWIRVVGRAGHAGTQPMELRRDALVAAALFVAEVEAAARKTSGLRATVGKLDVIQGAANVVPGEVRLSLDVRHADNAVRAQSVADLLHCARRIAADRGLAITFEQVDEQDSVPCDPHLTERLLSHCLKARRMVSGAGHDAVIMGSLCPMTMLFIRSPGGISHHRDESVRPEDVRAALETMVQFLSVELVREAQ